MPKYVRKNSLKPTSQIDDVTNFLEEILLFFRGRNCTYVAKSPILIITRLDKHKYDGMVIRFHNHQTKQSEIEFLSVYYDDLDKNSSPYGIRVNDRFFFTEDIDKGVEIIKACAGHYYYSEKKFTNWGYYIDERFPIRKDKPDIDKMINLLAGNRNIAVTKHDLLNAYLATLDPEEAYNRIRQRKMAKQIYKRFGIGTDDDDKLLGKPSYYLNKAMQYTDYKLVGVSSREHNTASAYYGMKLIVPREERDKVNYFDDIIKKIKKTIDERETAC